MDNYFTKTLKEFRKTNLSLWDVRIADSVRTFCWWNGREVEEELQNNTQFYEDLCSFVSGFTLKLDNDYSEDNVLQALDNALLNEDITLEDLKNVLENYESYNKVANACYDKL